MRAEDIAEMREELKRGYVMIGWDPQFLPRLLDEREALLNAAKEAAEGFDVVAADDMRLLALLRDAIAKAEAP